MSRETDVKLTVLTTQADAASLLFEYEFSNRFVKNGHVVYHFESIKWGDLPILSKLEEAGISYDSCWDGCNDYEAGLNFLRFTATGEPNKGEIYESERLINIDELGKLLDDPDKLKTFIKNHIFKYRIPPWDNQEDYGKLYRARRLIGGINIETNH